MATIEELKQFLAKKDFYDILGVEKQATEEEIRKSYRKLALKYHPDKNKLPGAQEAFRKVAQAYDCLSNAEKRRFYDQNGDEEPEQHYRHYRSHFSDENSPEDIFNFFFQQFNEDFGQGFGPGFTGFSFSNFGNGGQSFHFSTSGFRRQRMNNQRQQQENQQQPIQRFKNFIQSSSACYSFLKFAILFFILFGPSLSSLFASTPMHSNTLSSTYSKNRQSYTLQINYFVKPEFLDKTTQQQIDYDYVVEKEHVKNLKEICEKSKQQKYQYENYAKTAFYQKDRTYYQKEAELISLDSCQKINQFRKQIQNFDLLY